MAIIDCIVEDQEKRFQIELNEIPRVGEYIARGGVTYVIASVTWDVARRGPSVRLGVRELPPPP
ncbi:MAG TPA: hypothetical protein VIF62_19830 [Labilithrix sp.]|jgi:hypothetical protein